MALSCRRTLSIYRPELLADVTINGKSLLRFYLDLARNPDSGKLVRSITFTHRDVEELSSEEVAESHKDLPEMISAFRDQEITFEKEISIDCVVEGVYRFLPNIQTLIIHQPDFSIALQSTLAKDRLAPLPFLTHSLKKLFIPFWGNLNLNLKAKNVLWILVFCTGLRFAALGCVFDLNDFKCLAEFSDTFSGLSQVVKLSLGMNFTATESIRRYGDKSVGRQWIGGNKKSQAVFHLLKVTRNLQSLELNHHLSDKGEKTSIKPDCLSALKTSFKSLENLRLFGIGFDPEGYKAEFSRFVTVKVLSIDTLMILSLPKSLDVKLPPGLKILCIPYYYGHSSLQEDLELACFLKAGSLTTLESVVVPSRPIDRSGVVTGSEDFQKRWLEGRRELKKAETFQSGKVELRFVEPGELSEC